MEALLAVGSGGCVGALLRYGATKWAPTLPFAQHCPIPLGTLGVNLLGCLAIGVLYGIAESMHLLRDTSRLFLFTGLLGSFTTFSAFGWETLELMQRDQKLAALLYVTLSVIVGVLLVWLGYRAASAVFGNP